MEDPAYADDIAYVLSKQHVNGGEFWSTAQGAVGNGGPFSTLEASLLLLDLGYPPTAPELMGAADAIFRNLRPDGRIRTFAGGSLYPCQTAHAARTLCRLGRVGDPRLQATLSYLLASQAPDGGWRCNTSKYGHGPETAFSNPGPTLTVLDVFRCAGLANKETMLDRAVEFLLNHWVTRAPLGPCHYGIGTRFMKVEFPVVRYNILNFVHVLSFYRRATSDDRFNQAVDVLRSKLVENQLPVEQTNRSLKELVSCRIGRPSRIVTRYFSTALLNLQNQ